MIFYPLWQVKKNIWIGFTGNPVGAVEPMVSRLTMSVWELEWERNPSTFM